MRTIRIAVDATVTRPRPSRHLLLAGFAIAATLTIVGAAAAKPAKPPTGLAAFAFVQPTIQYLGDSVGSDLRFNVRNSGQLTIGAVEIARPSTSWLVVGCPDAPVGWTTQRSDNFCRYRSGAGTADDLQPGAQSDDFVLRAATAPGSANRTGTWVVKVSSSSNLDTASSLKPAPAEGVGLATTAFSFEVTDALVGTGTPGAACPAATAENHSAITGSTQTIVICGRNRMTIAATPANPPSSLSGTFIDDDGTFSSASIPAGSGDVILGAWTAADVTGTSGAGKSIVARIASTNARTSPFTTLDDDCGPSPAFATCIENGGYEALNEPPDAVDDEADADEDGPAVPIDVLANDSDPDGDPISIVSTGGSPAGLVTVTGTGTGIDYDPDGAFEWLASGETTTDTFTYTIEDTFGAADTATVTVTVTGANDEPDAADDAADADEDGPAVTVDVLANDTDDDVSDTLIVSAVDTTGTLGLVTTTNAGADVSYDPNGQFESLAAGETGTDTFTYSISDGNGGTDTATVTVTVSGVNDDPDAVDDTADADEAGPAVTIDVLANDTDGDASDTLTVSAVDATGTLGSVTITNAGADVSYDPSGQFESLAAGETATDTFTYSISDGNGGTDTATVVVTISGGNDGPDAVDDAPDADEDGPAVLVDVLANDTDDDGDALTVSAVDTTGTLGLVTNNGTDLTYDPAGQFDWLAAGTTATDTFTYTVSDGNGGTDTATVTVTVSGENDSPVAVGDLGDADEDGPAVTIDVLFNDADPDASDALVITGFDDTATVGLVTDNGDGTFDYDPNDQFESLATGETDTDSFTYTVSDGNGGTDTATVTVTIHGRNDDPAAADDVASTGELADIDIDVLANDTDPDATDVLSVQSVDTTGTLGIVTIGAGGLDVNYDPNGQFDALEDGDTGTDSFTYTISDGNGGTDVATVTVTINGTTDVLPTAVDDSATVAEDAAATAIDVLANDTDPDGGPKVISSASDPANGTVVLTGGSAGAHTGLTYEPDPEYCNDPPGTTQDTFTYTLNGGSTATVSVTVTCVNDVPDAVDDSGTGFTTDEDTAFITADVLANDTDGDGDTLTIVQFDVTGTAGTVTYNDDGTFDYDPNGQFDGLGVGESAIDVFTYNASDGAGGMDSATVTITITGVNDAPTAGDDADTTDEDTTKVVDVLANDSDVDVEPLVVSIVGTPDNGGTVSITNAGADVTFDPGSDFQDLLTGQSRDTSFTYTASDGNGGTDSATVTVTVTGVSDAPVADDETFTGADSAVGNTTLVVDDPTDGAPTVSGAKKSITGDILDGDTDVDGPGPLTVASGTFLTADGGSVTIEADGDFVYLPNVGVSCTDTSDSFSYTVEDSGSPELTDTGTVTVAISGCVWYVRNDAAAGGDGRSSQPFDTLEEADVAATTTGSTIYVHGGNGTTTGLTTTVDLVTNQRLHGEAIDLVVGGVTLFTGTPGQRPDLAGNILLDDNNHLSGFSIAGAASPAITGVAGDVNGAIADVTVTGTAGGLTLASTSGTWNLSDLTVSTTGGEAIAISNAGTVNFTSSGTISVTSAAGAGARILATTTSGVIDSVTVTSSPNEGIVLDDNPGSLTINDINLTTNGTGLMVDSSNDVTVSGGDADITAGGAAVSLTTVTSNPANPPDVTLDAVTSSGGTVGIFIDDIGVGTFSANSGTLSGHSLAELDVNGGSGDVAYLGDIGNGSGLSVDVSNRTGGTVSVSGTIGDTNDAGGGIVINNNSGGVTTFSGATKTLNTGAAPAVSLSLNAGHAININGGGLDIDTTSGAGLTATGGGVIQVTTGANPNTIDTGTGSAANISNTTISNAGMTFRSISANGATSGIILNATGNLGSFVVTGNTAGTCGTAASEADCSGGTIQNTTSHAISLTSTTGPSFTRINVKNNLGSGIAATGVAGLTISNSRIVNNADAPNISEAGISLTNVTGVSSIASSTVRDSFDNNVQWNASSGAGTVSVTGSTVGPTDALGNSGIQMIGTGTGSATLNVAGSTFPGNNASGIGTSFSGSSAHTVNVSGSTFTDNNFAVAIGTSDSADATFDINGNTALRSKTHGFQVLAGASSTSNSVLSGRIRNNTVGDANTDSGARDGYGIAVEVNDDAQTIMSIANNNIRHTDHHGIFWSARDPVVADGQSATSVNHLHVTNNTIASIDDNSAFPFGFVYGMLLDGRHESTTCLNIAGNTSTGIGGAEHIRVRQRNTSTFRLERLTDGDATPNETINVVSTVENFLVGQNAPGTTADGDFVSGFIEAADGACLDP